MEGVRLRHCWMTCPRQNGSSPSRKIADNHVHNLFFAHQKQIELLLANPDILLMDCTYRTNKYKLPLLHILGCTNLQTFFSAGFCFLHNETQEDYYWAISNFLLKTGTSEPRVFISDQEDALKLAARSLLPRVPQPVMLLDWTALDWSWVGATKSRVGLRLAMGWI